MGEEVSHDHSERAGEPCAIFGGGHEVDGDDVHGGVLGRIEYEMVHLKC